MFAIIKTGGKQYKVNVSDIITTEKIEGEKGSKVSIKEVLFIGTEDGKDSKIGTPYVSGATVEAEIIEQAKGKKVHIVKYKPKTRYHRNVGHRQLCTKIRIAKING